MKLVILFLIGILMHLLNGDVTFSTFYSAAGLQRYPSIVSSGGKITFTSTENDNAKSMGITVDPIAFYYTVIVKKIHKIQALTGDGSFSFLFGAAVSGTPQNTFLPAATANSRGGIMVRTGVSSGSEPMLALAFLNEIAYGTNQFAKIFYRSTANTEPSSETVSNPLLDGIYFGYVKITRTGNTLQIFISDDRVTWVLIKTITASLPSTLYWGIFVDPTVQDTITLLLIRTARYESMVVNHLRFEGFGLCSEDSYFDYTTQECSDKFTYLECGANNWRYRFLSDRVSNDQMNGAYPRVVVSSTTLFLESSLLLGYSLLSNDNLVFAFKFVGGLGSITAKSPRRTSTGGLMIRNDLKNEKDVRGVMVSCIIPKATNDVVMRYRTANEDATLVKDKTFTITSDTTPYWLRLELKTEKATCEVSSDGSTWTTVATVTWTPSNNYFVGVLQYGESTSANIEFTDISFNKFTGYCTNHGNCGTVSGNLDKCICTGGYFGDQCNLFSCGTPSCNNRGTCIAPSLCTCNAGYGGELCQYPICGGILSNETASCGPGTCTSPNTCSCPETYGGNLCQYPKCFGKLSTDGTVCSGHGSCISPDSCNCNAGWTGSNCEIPKCFSQIDPAACSGNNGTCTNPDSCDCTVGHTGTQCQHVTCFGKSSNDASVCSSHGTCTAPDSCLCHVGYTGTQCQTPYCYGQLDPTACSGTNGTCISHDQCNCASGHTGLQCQHFICFGKASNDAAVCSSHGTCQSPNSCHCDFGYTGVQCNIPMCFSSTDPSACSGINGTCIAPNTCSCTVGYTGSSCELFICDNKISNETNVCNGHGSCIGPNACLCQSTYDGLYCQNPICYGFSSTDTSNVCTGNGTCISPNNCQCNNGYFGDKCDVYSCSGILANSTNVCSSRGTCIGKDVCICDSGYTGNNCQFNVCGGKSSNDPQVCTGHGTCVAPETCNCISGWKHTLCETFTCQHRNDCSLHGDCVGPNNCSCISTYGGSNCSEPYCFGVLSTDPKVCSTKGICESPNNCRCISDGYSGIYCNVTVCTGVDDCSDNGICVGANNCSCFSGWKNSNCSTFHCDPVNNCTYPQGLCVGANNCSCSSQWSGSNCNSPICYSISGLDPSVCSGNGNCSSPDFCSCKENWTGQKCEIPICNNKNASDPTTCNSRGACTLPNNCTCHSGYTGNDCQFNLCFGISSGLSTVCSAHGSCTSPNICNCTSEYAGAECNFPICYGFSSNQIQACTNQSRGSCDSPNNCTCKLGYTGEKCEHNICYGVISNSSTVCSSHGNCTNPDQCSCDPGFYGSQCENSHLYDFISSQCTMSNCKLNLTQWLECTKVIGVKCYCSGDSPLNNENINIQCDSKNFITSIKIVDGGLSGALVSMKNFEELKLLNFTSNILYSNVSFNSILPSKIENVQLGNNNIQNVAAFYRFFTNELPNFKSLYLDGNALCGVIPFTWRSNPNFTISLQNHNQSFWCTSFRSENVCSRIKILFDQYVMFPHETNVTLSYTPQNVDNICLDYLTHNSVKCNVKKFDQSASSSYDVLSTVQNQRIQCGRSLYNDIDQYINFAWRYADGSVEPMSTDVHLVNLPYVNFIGTDRHLIHSENNGKTQEILIYTDQNMTRYRKLDSDVIQCFIGNNGEFYNVPAVSLDETGKVVKCIVNLTQPDTGLKKIFLSDKERNSVANGFASIWLVNPKITNSEIYSSFIGDILIRDSTGAKLPGKSGFSYALTNDIHGYSFPCIFASDAIQSCTKSTIVNFDEDITIIPLNFTDGNFTISTINSLFYRKNDIQNVFPKASLSDQPVDIVMTFNTSTFNSSLNSKYYCIDQFSNYTGIVLNVTSIKCLGVQHNETQTLSFDIYAVNGDFKAILNEKLAKFYVIKSNSIYPSTSVVSFSPNRIFSFSFVETVNVDLKAQLECQLDTLEYYNAVWKSTNDFECNITSTNHHNLTFWFRNIHNQRIQLSSNHIELFLFKTETISYINGTTQFGLTGNQYITTVRLDASNIPSKFTDQVTCTMDDIEVNTVELGNSLFNCTVTASQSQFRNISLKFKLKNYFKVSGVHNTFENRLNLTYSIAVVDTLNLKHTLNTKSLIQNGEMKSDCSDLIVTYEGSRIYGKITGCNTTTTIIEFKVQKTESVAKGYMLFYGNPTVTPIQGSVAISTYSSPAQAQLSEITKVKLNKVDLQFGFLKQFQLNKVDPFAALITNSVVNITSNYVPFDYLGNVKFQIRFNENMFDSTFDGVSFNAIISATSKASIDLEIWIVYLPTQESLIAKTVHSLYLYPFADKFTSTINQKNTTVQVYLSSNLTTETGLYCQFSHNNTKTYSNARFLSGNSSLVDCRFEISGLTSVTEFVSVDLYMNVSSNSIRNFIISKNNLSIVFFKEPIQLMIPATIDKNYFNQKFSINFNDPLRIPSLRMSYSSYKFSVIPEFSNPISNLNCTFDSEKPICEILNLTLTHSPIKLNYSMIIASDYFPEQITFEMSHNYFKQNVTFETEFPFVADALELNPFNVLFKIDKFLNPSFTFYCRIHSIDSQIVKISDNEFRCTLQSRGYEESVRVSLVIKGSSIDGLDGLISEKDSTIQLVTLKFVPEFSETNELSALIVSKNNSQNFIIPPNYLTYQYLMSSNGYTFNCSVVQSQLNCSKRAIASPSNYDIFSYQFIIRYRKDATESFVNLINVRQGLLLYENHEIIDFFPLASLVDTNVTITSTFDDRTFSTSISEHFNYFCSFNGSSWQGSKLSENSITCPIVYSDHKTNEFRLKSYITIPTLSGNKEIYITVNNSKIPFYYLNPATITFKTNQIQFFYTNTLVDLSIDIDQLIPSVLNQFLVIKLSSGFAPKNNFSSNGPITSGNSSITISTGGTKNLTLWYKQNNYEFQLSSNPLEVVFARISQITGIEPLVAIVNRTNTLTVSSAFPTFLDYGSNVNFTCKYGTNVSRYDFNAIATIDQNGRFFCSVYSETVGLSFISLWMQAKSIERKISLTDIELYFLTADFFTPSHGFPSGNEKRFILDYDRDQSNVTFSNPSVMNKYVFICNKTIYSNKTALECLTPMLPNSLFPVYSSHPMIYTADGKSLSMSWIVYERREIAAFYPEVAPESQESFTLNITLNQTISIYEGSLFVVLAPGTNDIQRYDLGKLNGTDTASTTISKLPGGNWNLELFYYNPNSFEFKSMFSISSQKNITFLTKSTIQFIAGKNILYLNERTNVTIKIIENVFMNDVHKPKVKCSLGGAFIETFYNASIPDEYICTISSEVEKIDSIALFYKDELALNGAIDISKNRLDVIFVQKENVTSIAPFASISSNQQVHVTSTLNASVYSSKVNYECFYNGSTFAAILDGNTIKCTLSTSFNFAFADHLKLRIKSVETGISLFLTDNEDESTLFYFLKRLTSKSLYPFIQTHKLIGSGYLSEMVTLQLESPLILIKEVYCQYIDSQGSAMLSKATYKDENKTAVRCHVESRKFQKVVEDLQVGLWLNATKGLTFELTNVNQTYLFIREPLAWESLKVFNQNETLGHRINFTRKGKFDYSVEMIPNVKNASKSLLDCHFSNYETTCNFTKENIDSVQYNPSFLNSTLFIRDLSLNISSSVSIDRVTFYSTVEIQHLKPYLISYYDHLYSPIRIISNIYKKLNSLDFKFKCNITQNLAFTLTPASFEIQPNEFQPGLDNETHYSCTFKTFGNGQFFQVQLIFQSDLGDLVLTPKGADLYAVKSRPTFSPTLGPFSGDFQLSPGFTFLFPTLTYKDYNLTFKFAMNDGYKEIPCSSNLLTGCVVPSMNSIYDGTNQTKRVKLELHINSLRSIALSPYFTFYPEMKVNYVHPSRLVATRTIGQNGHSLEYHLENEFQYFGEEIKIRYYLGKSEDPGRCSFKTLRILSCSSPTFETPGKATVSLSIGPSIYYLNVTLELYDPKIISFSSSSTSQLNFEKNTSLVITGSNFLETNIVVKLHDASIQKIIDGQFINTTTFHVNVSPFYDLNVVLPRTISLQVSFDSGATFIDSSIKFTIPKVDDFKFTPNMIPISTHTKGISIVGLDKFQSTTNPLILRLYRINGTEFISLICNTAMTLCNTSSIPTVLGEYEMKVGYILNDKWMDYYLFTRDVMKTYKLNSQMSIQPTKFFKDSSNPIRIQGNFTAFQTVLFKFTLQPAVFSTMSTEIITYGVVTDTEIRSTVPRNKTISFSEISIEVSFNDGVYYHFIQKLPVISYQLDYIEPKEQNIFLVSDGKLATIKGKGFSKNTPMKLVFENPIKKYDLTSFTNAVVQSSTDIQFAAPQFSYFNLTFEPKFPFTFNLGVSFNDGHDFIYIPFVYVNAYPQAVYTGINPTVSVRKELNVTLFGLDLHLAKYCSIYGLNVTLGLEIYESVPISINVSNSILCHIPLNISLKYDQVVVTLKNEQGELNEARSFILYFYNAPNVTNFSPNEAPSYSSEVIKIYGTGFLDPRTSFVHRISCRFGDILCDKPCVYETNETLTCNVQAHPPTDTEFAISYNRIDWHPVTTHKFKFTTCQVGYTAENYKIPCRLCSPGTYKPTYGLYGCIKCENGTYTDFAGSTSCKKCPTNTTNNILGSSSPHDCVCDSGFYLNPSINQHSDAHLKCINCPGGSWCNQTNTTVPLAKFGFWRSQSNYHNFYECNPKISCQGGGAENCTAGYTGMRCGVCEIRHYKFQGKCIACESPGWTWLRLFGIFLAFSIVTVLFFALSSVKVHHIASIAIAISFWQVISMFARFDIDWPSLIGGSLTAASTTNFNTDFLSPNCVFPGMRYSTLWIIQMLVPVGFVISFTLLYLLLVARSSVAGTIGDTVFRKFLKLKYIGPEKKDPTVKISKLSNIKLEVKNSLIYVLNFILWAISEGSTPRELLKFFNSIINAMLSLLSFSFIYIMTTASEVFVCTTQPNGVLTLNSSPDIICLEGEWWIMAPISMLCYIIFGGGSILYFMIIFVKFKDWEKNRNFIERNKFILTRFRKKLFFWEAVDTVRKTIISICYIFLEEMLVIVFGIIILYAGLLLQIHFVPFKRKFHNLMEYFILIVSLTTLFFGLLFYVKRFPSQETELISEWLAFLVIIFSTIAVGIMIAWDAYTRRKNDKKRIKYKFRKLLKLHEKDEEMRQFFVEMHDLDPEEDIFHVKQVPWDTDYKFIPFHLKSESETPEAEFDNINDIFENLFSFNRFKKKVFLIKRKGTRTTQVIKNISHKRLTQDMDPEFQQKLKKVKQKTIFQGMDEKLVAQQLLLVEKEKQEEELEKKKVKKPHKPEKPRESRQSFSPRFGSGDFSKSVRKIKSVHVNRKSPNKEIKKSEFQFVQSQMDVEVTPVNDHLSDSHSEKSVSSDRTDKPWRAYWDSVSGFPYYHNAITGESTWVKPSNYENQNDSFVDNDPAMILGSPEIRSFLERNK